MRVLAILEMRIATRNCTLGPKPNTLAPEASRLVRNSCDSHVPCAQTLNGFKYLERKARRPLLL